MEEIIEAIEKMKDKLEAGFKVVGLVSDGLKSVVKHLSKKRKD